MRSFSAVIKWAAGILSTVIAGVAIFYLTQVQPPQDNGEGTPSVPGPRVVEAMLRADPFNYEGTCPVEIRFSGRISVAGGPGSVTYRFIRSDGASAPVQVLNFDGPGSKNVSTTWRLGAPTSRFNPYRGWQAIKILDPVEKQSNKASFTLRCQ
jgi:hypothetical protein